MTGRLYHTTARWDRVKDRQTAGGGVRSTSLTRAQRAKPSMSRVQGRPAPEPLLSTNITPADTRAAPLIRAITCHMSASPIARQRGRLVAPC